MISRKNGTRLKKRKTLKNVKGRVTRGGMFEAQTNKLLKLRPVSSKTILKSTAQSGQTDLLLARLGIPTDRDPNFSMQFATQSYIKAKQRETILANKLLEYSKELRKRNDFVNAALVLRQAIELGSLPARAELADFFRTRRQMKPNPNAWDEYYEGQSEHIKAHDLVYGQDDPDCKGVLALLYLDYLNNRECFGWRRPNDPLLHSRYEMNEIEGVTISLAQESADAGSKYGIFALAMCARLNVKDINNQMDRVKEHAPSEIKDKLIERLLSEEARVKRASVVLIGIAAKPPHNYDVAQLAYAGCADRGDEGVSLSVKDSSESPAAKYLEMAAAQGLQPAIDLLHQRRFMGR